MALSIVCKTCNAQLKSVSEAQEHNTVTGHSNFEESTEAVRACDYENDFQTLSKCPYKISMSKCRTASAEQLSVLSQVLNLVCTECGKPCRYVRLCATWITCSHHALGTPAWGYLCRSATEKELHTKRTGHSSFVDKVRHRDVFEAVFVSVTWQLGSSTLHACYADT